jgi:hypothetical protein
MEITNLIQKRRKMNSIKKTPGLDMKAKLSTLWIFVLLNVIFRDIHELFRPGFLAEMMTGTVNGNPMTEGFLLLAGIMLEIQIAMVILSRMLKYRINRWANIIAGLISMASIIVVGVNDLDDIFFAGVEIVALVLIVWFAWKWVNPEPGLGSEN